MTFGKGLFVEWLGNAFSQQVKCQRLRDWKDRLDLTWKCKIPEPKDQKCHLITYHVRMICATVQTLNVHKWGDQNLPAAGQLMVVMRAVKINFK